MRRHREDRRDGTGGGQAEVAALRQSIAMLATTWKAPRAGGGGGSDGMFLVPAGTDIRVMLDQDLSSARPISRTASSLDGSSRTAGRPHGAPAGASVSGVVARSPVPASRATGRLAAARFWQLDAGRRPDHGYALARRVHCGDAAGRQHRPERRAGALLGGVVGGIIDGRKGVLIGAALGAGGGFVASQGNDVDLPQGTLITLRLDAPMAFARRREP